MPDRLDDLRRQRELVRQHLAWLDAEIARDRSPAGVPTSDSAPLPEAAPRAAAAPADAADTLLARYQAEAGQDSRRVKLGCWIVFFAAFASLAVFVGGWYLLRFR